MIKGWFVLTNNYIKDTDFLGLTSMLRSRMSRMLDAEKLERLVSTADTDDVAKQLTDAGYPDMSGMDSRDVDKVLCAYRSAIFSDLARDENAGDIVDMFRMKYDYHNIKVLVKSAGSAVSLLSDSGRVPAEKVADAYIREETDQLPKDMHSAITEVQDVLARTGDSQLADIAADKAYFAALGALAEKTGSSFLTGYVRLMVDSANLRTLVRSARMEKTLEFVLGALIEGGSMMPSTIAPFYSAEGIAEVFSTTRLAEAAALGSAAIPRGPLTAFERECDNALADYLADASLVSFGPGPVAAYLSHLENEIMSIRVIITSKLSGASPETIRERLRDCHV